MTNSDAATQQGVARVAPDWERIEVEFRAGLLSIREVAKLNGVTDTAIRKKAKALGWERDLSAKVAEKVRSELVRTQVRAERTAEQVRTEKQVIEEAAATVVEVVRSHRKRLSFSWRIAAALEAQLMAAVDNREEILEDIEILTAGDANKNRRYRMERAVELPAHVATLKDLALTMKAITSMERQAFGLADGDDPAPKQPDADADRKVERARNDSLMDKLRDAAAKRGS